MMARMPQRRSFAVPASASLVLALLTTALGVSPAPAQQSSPPPSFQQLFKQSAPAVVLITQYTADDHWTSLGTGFIVSSSGVIVTNNHVIAPDQGATRIAVKLPRGDVYNDVRIIYTEARRDFAVLSIKATGLRTLKVGDSDQVEVGDQVVAIGNPQGLDLTFTSGIVESVRLDPDKGYRFIQHQAPISHGSSGGPLLNMSGEVIGINTFSVKDSQNLNGAIPINYVKPYFGDTARMTWEEYASKVSATAPAAAVPPRAVPPAPAPVPSRPPSTAGAGSSPGTVFERISTYRPQDDTFRRGFTAGVYDIVSLYAATIEGSGKNDQEVLALFQCLDGKGEHVPQLRSWVDSTVANASSDDSNIIVAILARACQTSFAPGKYVFFEHNVSDYQGLPDIFKNGFAAGVYDMVSLMAAAARGSGGIDNQKALALFRCLDGKGDRVGQLSTWVDSAVTQASSDSAAVVSAVVDMCLP